MTRDEIAAFLEVSSMQVELLWRCNLLQKSLACPNRPIPIFSSSTVYDVLEYALAAGVLPVTVSKEVAALWVLQLAQADEWDRFAEADFGMRVCLMVEMAMEDGLSEMTTDVGKVATVVVASQMGLLDRCGARQVAV